METTGIRISAEDQYYLPLRIGEEDPDLEVVSSDDFRLKQLGYKQELSRNLSCVFLIFFLLHRQLLL
ncbi:hypothetical protein Pint_22074 [Pistacia integerrima]|uniref:Uncharacterized protein n=1 Tax=Pistacia integerrima TaxID=434235 RepID=A0ACC0YH38_9ROSI|nr:hypothetical protein Pint_22074 [Pistacia integerrima]